MGLESLGLLVATGNKNARAYKKLRLENMLGKASDVFMILVLGARISLACIFLLGAWEKIYKSIQ